MCENKAFYEVYLEVITNTMQLLFSIVMKLVQ
jgi:hypothetical protein